MLPGVKGLKGPLSCLSQARYGISWGVIGAGPSVLRRRAVQHATSRNQFKKPIGQFQLVQNHIADMLADITKAQLVAWRLGRMKDEGTMRPPHVSLAKRDNVRTALAVARQSRQVLGGNGVLGTYPGHAPHGQPGVGRDLRGDRRGPHAGARHGGDRAQRVLLSRASRAAPHGRLDALADRTA